MISDNGDMVFFTSSEKLLPDVENTSAGACKAPVRQQRLCLQRVRVERRELVADLSGKSPLPSQLMGRRRAAAKSSSPLSLRSSLRTPVSSTRSTTPASTAGSPRPPHRRRAAASKHAVVHRRRPLLRWPRRRARAFRPGEPTPPAPSSSEPAEAPKPKPLTSAQKLSKALKACKKDKSKSKRLACERSARKKYAPPQ